MAPAGPSAGLARSRLARPIVDEWLRLERGGSITAALRRWNAFDLPDGAGGEQLLEHLGFGRVCGSHTVDETSTEPSDAPMARLIELAVSDPLAARVALQRVLPALVAIAKRRGRGAVGERHAFNEVVATAWIVIREYPLDRRPNRIVSNIVRDAEYRTFVRPVRMKSSQEQAHPLNKIPMPAAGSRGRSVTSSTHAFETVVAVLKEARERGLAPEDLWLAAAMASGRPTRSIAAELGMTTRTVLNRRDRAVSRLRSLELAA